MKITRQVRLCVRELAAERGIDERMLASQARVDVRVVRRMMNNQQVRDMTLSQIARVAEVLQVPTGALFVDN